MKRPAPYETLTLDPRLVRALRSDHAGEAGAVEIYRGMLACTRNPQLRRFAETHLRTEQQHLAFFNSWLSPAGRSHALPLWRLAGWLLGAVSALGGARMAFQTVRAVESFVDDHYAAQLRLLAPATDLVVLADTIASLREDELEHRDDAALRLSSAPGWPAQCWSALIDTGSRLGVALAARI